MTFDDVVKPRSFRQDKFDEIIAAQKAYPVFSPESLQVFLDDMQKTADEIDLEILEEMERSVGIRR